jgi:hypothetical protein
VLAGVSYEEEGERSARLSGVDLVTVRVRAEAGDAACPDAAGARRGFTPRISASSPTLRPAHAGIMLPVQAMRARMTLTELPYLCGNGRGEVRQRGRAIMGDLRAFPPHIRQGRQPQIIGACWPSVAALAWSLAVAGCTGSAGGLLVTWERG